MKDSPSASQRLKERYNNATKLLPARRHKATKFTAKLLIFSAPSLPGNNNITTTSTAKTIHKQRTNNNNKPVILFNVRSNFGHELESDWKFARIFEWFHKRND
uniref:Uncharacterized protein n=1 Tax=Glossina austeni TaxID=7395 RepID=A0A1A9V0N0_GLOAU